jgi:murein DD-endopeptidase MepM/ murein hydrolase activator NlpD
MLHLVHPALSRAAALDPHRLRQQALVAAATLVAAGLLLSSTVSATLAAATESAESVPVGQVFVAASDDAVSEAALAATAALAAAGTESEAPAAEAPAREAFTIDQRPPLVYPVGAGAPVGSAFGPRALLCDACSTQHFGVDFNPAYGAPVSSIADGVVSLIGDPSNSLGVHLAIDHIVNGQTVTSVYAHLQAGSIPWKVGDRVRVGDVVGLVGTTGVITGVNLHFELRVGGTAINPVPWMAANGAQ